MQTLRQLPTPTPWNPSDLQSPDPLRPSKLRLKIQSSLVALTASDFCDRFLSQLRSSRVQDLLAGIGPRFHLVIYGIGSIECNELSRLQVSLALHLRRELGARILSVQLFDPVLTWSECMALEDLGFRIMTVNEAGAREVDAPTLFFMPHCTVGLYNNLLKANWTPRRRLKKIAILGNSFSSYRKNAKHFGDDKEIAEVMTSERFVTEVELEVEPWRQGEEISEVTRAFCTTSWHFFSLIKYDNIL